MAKVKTPEEIAAENALPQNSVLGELPPQGAQGFADQRPQDQWEPAEGLDPQAVNDTGSFASQPPEQVDIQGGGPRGFAAQPEQADVSQAGGGRFGEPTEEPKDYQATFQKQERANEKAEEKRSRMIERIKRSPPERRQRMIDNFNKRWSGERSPAMTRMEDGTLVVGNAYISPEDVGGGGAMSQMGGRGQRISVPSAGGVRSDRVAAGTEIQSPEGNFRVQTKNGKKFNVPIIRDPKTGVSMPDPDSFKSKDEFLEYRTPEDARNISQAIKRGGGASASRLQEIDRAREGIRKSRAPMEAKREALAKLDAEESDLQYEFLNRHMDGQAWGGAAQSEPVNYGQVQQGVDAIMQRLDPKTRAALMQDPEKLKALYEQVHSDLSRQGQAYDANEVGDPTGRFGFMPEVAAEKPSGMEVRAAVTKAFDKLSPEQKREILSDPDKRKDFEQRVYDLMIGGEYVPGETDIGDLTRPGAEEVEEEYVPSKGEVKAGAKERFDELMGELDDSGEPNEFRKTWVDASEEEREQIMAEIEAKVAEDLRVSRDPYFVDEEEELDPDFVGPVQPGEEGETQLPMPTDPGSDLDLPEYDQAPTFDPTDEFTPEESEQIKRENEQRAKERAEAAEAPPQETEAGARHAAQEELDAMDEADVAEALANVPEEVEVHARKELKVAKELTDEMKDADYSSMSPSKTVDFFVDIIKRRFEIDPSGRANPVGDGDFTSDAQWDKLIKFVKGIAKDNPNMDGVEEKVRSRRTAWKRAKTRLDRRGTGVAYNLVAQPKGGLPGSRERREDDAMLSELDRRLAKFDPARHGTGGSP